MKPQIFKSDSSEFNFKILARDNPRAGGSKARAGKIATPHGVIRTPVYMAVGTQATVKALDGRDLTEIGADIILGNTYHLYLRPGSKLIKNFGGLHKFMKWEGPILTDSGGYQVTSLGWGTRLSHIANNNQNKSLRSSFQKTAESARLKDPFTFNLARGPVASFPPASAPSHIRFAATSERAVGIPSAITTPRLSKENNGLNVNCLVNDKIHRISSELDDEPALVKIKDDGVEFRSHWDGSLHTFTPEKAIEIQHDLGSDIIMAFDEATPLGASYEYAKEAMERTHAWAKRSLAQHLKLKTKNKNNIALFGIIQGGFYKDLRRESAKFITSLNFDGIAVGGGDIGSDLKKTGEIFDWIREFLPDNKPIYAMGVGVYPQDIIDIISMGVDMFDCVAPTRIARSGLLYEGELKKKGNWFTFKSKYEKGRLTITKLEFAKDKRPIAKDCGCYTCKTYSRAYLHHLFKVRELLAYRLASIHNLYFMNNLVNEIRENILKS